MSPTYSDLDGFYSDPAGFGRIRQLPAARQPDGDIYEDHCRPVLLAQCDFEQPNKSVGVRTSVHRWTDTDAVQRYVSIDGVNIRGGVVTDPFLLTPEAAIQLAADLTTAAFALINDAGRGA
ncbi:hypothetical protein KKP62_01570 [Rhodococcus sp. GOMB7]|uniref:hypothetical protein n=1 Tax=Rhodococcus sp. GOMB7 TaxID=2839033 RepID=UPI001C007BA7|nr:hypothetical protein [Rhodococcus sp. GOMB7]MBT9293654.1 hypothetical protein [Rhodococcus sp. GOMB7]